MEKIKSIFAALLLSASMILPQEAKAQAPEKISYQTIVRNASNNLVVSTALAMRISVLQTTANSTAVYVETHSPTTNANGLVSLEIGTGTPITGTFANIDWANGPFFVKTEIDPANGTNYTIIGTSQLLSVPYALYAQRATVNTFTYSLTGDATGWQAQVGQNKTTEELPIVTIGTGTLKGLTCRVPASGYLQHNGVIYIVDQSIVGSGPTVSGVGLSPPYLNQVLAKVVLTTNNSMDVPEDNGVGFLDFSVFAGETVNINLQAGQNLTATWVTETAGINFLRNAKLGLVTNFGANGNSYDLFIEQ